MGFYPDESTHDEWLREQGFFEQEPAVHLKAELAAQIRVRMQSSGMDRLMLAERMQTSAAAVDRLLDGNTDLITLNLIHRAARALGAHLRCDLQSTPPVTIVDCGPADAG